MLPPIIRQLVDDLDGVDFSSFFRSQSAREDELVGRLPLGRLDLVAYLKNDPDRMESIVDAILQRCRALLEDGDRSSIRGAVPCVQALLQTVTEIESLELEKLREERDMAAYYESLEYTSGMELVEEDFRSMRDRRMERTGRDVSSAEEFALWELARLWVFDKEGFASMTANIAIDVVIWKMLLAWLQEMTSTDVRASETDLFGANQLQLIEGYSGMVIGRSKIEELITQASLSYSGADLSDSKTVIAQTKVEELFPRAPLPLFWWDGQPFTKYREDRRARKNFMRKSLTTTAVKTWRCDSCANSYKPGFSDNTLIPWDFRPDKRNGARTDVILRESLPEKAYPESRFMCTCWEKSAGVLYPVFA